MRQFRVKNGSGLLVFYTKGKLTGVNNGEKEHNF